MRSHGTRRFEILLLALVVLLGIDVLSRLPQTAQAEQAPNRLLGFAATPSKSGGNVVIWRQWSNGVIDKRLYTNSSNVQFQDGWVVVERAN